MTGGPGSRSWHHRSFGIDRSADLYRGPILARVGAGPGAPGWPRSASLELAGLPPAPVYLAALGPQMLRLAGEIADGTLLNWATPERIALGAG